MPIKPYSDLRYLELELKVLTALNIAGGQLSQSQVSMGPLRHVTAEERETVIARLRKVRFIEEVEMKPKRGPKSLYHRLTDKGRREIPASTT